MTIVHKAYIGARDLATIDVAEGESGIEFAEIV